MTGRMFSFRVSARLAALLEARRDRSQFIRDAVTEKLLGEALPAGADDRPPTRVETDRLRAGLGAISEASAALLADGTGPIPGDLRAGLLGIQAAAQALACGPEDRDQPPPVDDESAGTALGPPSEGLGAQSQDAAPDDPVKEQAAAQALAGTTEADDPPPDPPDPAPVQPAPHDAPAACNTARAIGAPIPCAGAAPSDPAPTGPPPSDSLLAGPPVPGGPANATTNPNPSREETSS